MMTIEVDFDVFKALTHMRPREDVTHNDVLRGLLKLPKSKIATAERTSESSAQGAWIAKAVRFPAGTEFRATYKGKEVRGRVEAGALVVNETRFSTPSAAAVAVTGSPVNGWSFWECRLPGQAAWKMLKAIRAEVSRR
ncbi:MAG: hypothetical protein JWN94_2627 [Betaproteobacteria bacterium]|nr:hypothetical protein [Betaproteobacteria bacterium]